MTISINYHSASVSERQEETVAGAVRGRSIPASSQGGCSPSEIWSWGTAGPAWPGMAVSYCYPQTQRLKTISIYYLPTTYGSGR